VNHREKVAANLQAIPEKKRESKVTRTLLGMGMVAVAGVIAKYKPDWPWQVPVFSGALGLLAASGEILLHPFKLLVAGILDIVDALKGSKSDDAR
jgi:hypothetical protein